MQTIPVWSVWAFKDTAGLFNRQSRVQDMEQRNVNKAANKRSTSFSNLDTVFDTVQHATSFARAITDFQMFYFLVEYFNLRSLAWTASINWSRLAKVFSGLLNVLRKKKLNILTGRVVKLLQDRSTTVALGKDAWGESIQYIRKQLKICFSNILCTKATKLKNI